MRSLLQAARQICAALSPKQLVHLCVRLPAATARLQQGGACLLAVPGWSPPLALFSPQEEVTTAAGPGERALALGYGQAALLCPMGEGRIEALMAQGQRLLSSLHVLRSADCSGAPSARLLGGLRFAPQSTAPDAGSAKEDPWHGLPDAYFVLPRWLLCLHQGDAYLQLNTRVLDLLEGTAIAHELEQLEAAIATAPEPVARVLSGSGHMAPTSDAAAWQALVERALAEIAQGQLDKVVLARGQVLPAPAGCEVSAVLARLSTEYPTCMRFALPLADATLVGATPELLVARQGQKVRCDALAGSRPRRDAESAASGATSALCAQAAVLLADEKEAREHAHVVAALAERLRPLVRAIAPAAVRARVLRNLIHLWTPIEAELRAPTHVLQLVAALHPTPAVCGVPQQAAAQFIAAQEALPRGYYAAPIGWFDADGDGEFFVAIRSALLRGGQAWLFAGAGIVAGSQPAQEYRETAAKLQPMLAALGIMPPPSALTAPPASEA